MSRRRHVRLYLCPLLTMGLVVPIPRLATAQSDVSSPAESDRESELEAKLESDRESELEAEIELEFTATASVEAPPRETTKRVVEQEELTRIPGTRGDALRAVEVLPGVGRTAFASDGRAPILRGSAADDSIVLLDGAEVPLLYHFGGLTSFFNSHLLESVELYPGNFSSRYGRASGGVVEARVRAPKSDRLHALMELSLIDTFALFEGPLAPNTSLAVAARRSNIDLVFESLAPEGTFQVVAAPVYYDYQAVLDHEFSRRHDLRVMAYGSRDALKLVIAEPDQNDPALRGTVEGVLEFHRVQAHLQSRFSDVVHQKLQVSAGPALADQKLGELDARLAGMDVYLRAEWSIFAHESLRIDAGIDSSLNRIDGRYFGPPPIQDEGNPGIGGTLQNQATAEAQRRFWVFRPAVYADASYRPSEDWLLVPGVRADYTEDANSWSVDPRLTSRYSLSEDTTLKSGVGLYSDAPEYYLLMPELGNPRLGPTRALHLSAGVEQRVAPHSKVSADGFYKRLQDRVVGTEAGTAPYFDNDGRGRVFGAELSAILRPTERSHGYLSYTWSRSERQDRNEPWRLFDYDQTHNLSLAGNYDVGGGFIVGARFRYVTGDPLTPIVGSTYNATNDSYIPEYGAVNSDRRSAFHQLDLRVEKGFRTGPLLLTAYLEVLNAYNAQNVEGMSYSYDYSDSEKVTGLPLFPNLGLRGEL